MDNFQIDHILRSHHETRDKYAGVFPSNLLPTRCLKPPQFVIANSGHSGTDGEHWLCINLGKKVEFFDSFALPVRFYPNIYEFVRRQGAGEFHYSTRTLQSVSSNVCGLYSVLFGLYACRGESLNSFARHFTDNVLLNDCRVQTLFQKEFSSLLTLRPSRMTAVYCQLSKSFRDWCPIRRRAGRQRGQSISRHSQ